MLYRLRVTGEGRREREREIERMGEVGKEGEREWGEKEGEIGRMVWCK